jgi:hypothetical protein
MAHLLKILSVTSVSSMHSGKSRRNAPKADEDSEIYFSGLKEGARPGGIRRCLPESPG